MTKDHLATLCRLVVDWGSGCAEGDAAAWAIEEIKRLADCEEACKLKNQEIGILQSRLEGSQAAAAVGEKEIERLQTKVRTLRNYCVNHGLPHEPEKHAVTNDLLKRLRQTRIDGSSTTLTMREAADEIARLQTGLERAYSVWSRAQEECGPVADRMADALNEALEGRVTDEPCAARDEWLKTLDEDIETVQRNAEKSDSPQCNGLCQGAMADVNCPVHGIHQYLQREPR